MTDEALFNALFSGGKFALPYLIKLSLSSSDTNPICLVNNNEDVTYDGVTYTAASFTYSRPDAYGSGGSLSISGVDNSLIEFVEDAGEDYSLEVIGVLKSPTDIAPIHIYKHMHGSVTYDENQKIEFTLSGDDRLEIQFIPYKFDTDNNRAGA